MGKEMQGVVGKGSLAEDFRDRSWPPALPGTRSCPGPADIV